MARRDRTTPLLKELNQVLGALPKESSKGTLEDGELYICPTCDLPLKPCELHSGNRCASMIRGNTQLAIVESTIHESMHSEQRFCLRCGQPIAKRLLSRNPLRELCSECSPNAQRKPRRRSSPGASI